MSPCFLWSEVLSLSFQTPTSRQVLISSLARQLLLFGEQLQQFYANHGEMEERIFRPVPLKEAEMLRLLQYFINTLMRLFYLAVHPLLVFRFLRHNGN